MKRGSVREWLWRHLPGSYRSELSQLRIYWCIYGGRRALLRSPYLGLAAVITVLCFGAWLERGWWGSVFAIIPSILGFSLTGFAVFLAFGDERFRRVIAGGNPSELESDPSPYVGFTSAFMHFIVVQVVAIFLALVAQSEPLRWLPASGIFAAVLGACRQIFWFIGYLSFAYALTCAFASSIGLFRMVKLYDESVWREKERKRSAAVPASAVNDDSD